jgi:hypothetical protein
MWILAGGDDEVHSWRQVLDQEGEGIVYRVGINEVVVIEHEEEIVRDGSSFVEQGRQNRFGRRRLGGLKRPQRPFSDIRGDRPQGGD